MNKFKNIISILVLLSLCNTSIGCIARQQHINPKNLTFPPIDYTPPEAERRTLKNGMIIYLMEDHELPLFNVNVMIRTGSVFEPSDLVGLASVVGTTMRTGGTRFMTGDEINEALEFIAGSVETSIGQEAGHASLSVLKKDIDLGLKILFDILRYPVFEQKKIDLKKNQMLESIRRQNDNPKRIAHREFNKIIYKNHPYGRFKTEGTIKAITRDDVIDFHKRYYHPNNIMLGITGDFDTEEIIKKIEELTKDWDESDVDFPDVPDFKKRFQPSVNYVYKDIPQTVINIGHIGIMHNNPDYYSLVLANYILGGGSFQSRLMKEVRSEKGLAYSIWSSFGAGQRVPGVFFVSSETKASSTGQVLESIIENIDRLRRSLVSEEEIKTAKEHIINSFIFRFTSNEQIISQKMNIEYFNMPKDYLETYRDRIRGVTRDDILNAAKKYMHPDKLTYFVVGDKDKFDKPLSAFGDVNTIILKKD